MGANTGWFGVKVGNPPIYSATTARAMGHDVVTSARRTNRCPVRVICGSGKRLPSARDKFARRAPKKNVHTGKISFAKKKKTVNAKIIAIRQVGVQLAK